MFASANEASIIYDKFVMHSPLYRQEQDWLSMGLKLSRQTMSYWVIYCAEKYFRSIYVWDAVQTKLEENKKS